MDTCYSIFGSAAILLCTLFFIGLVDIAMKRYVDNPMSREELMVVIKAMFSAKRS